ncbi:MAG: hypothetical protein RRB22_11505 [Gammaproteobacteria bacterium]|nr:hypothetical protein [Gammaproteobacteria bacterium]
MLLSSSARCLFAANSATAYILLLLWPLFLLLLVQSATAADRPQLILELDKSELELGHHINARLYGVQLQEKLGKLELKNHAPLQEHFAIDIVETSAALEDSRWPGQSIQRMLLKLYPRHSGELRLPALQFAGATSEAQTIRVTPGVTISRAGNTPIRRELRLSSTQPWERQQVHIEVSITSTDRFASLRAGQFELPGFEVFAVPASSEKLVRDGVDYSLLRIGWIVFPLLAGEHTIELPPIEYRLSGRTLRTYFSPRQRLEVKALPAYIPPTMPVGRVEVSSTLHTEAPLSPAELSYWDVGLTASGVSPSWLPPILRQLNTRTDIQFFSHTAQPEVRISQGVLHSQVQYHIPFKPLSSGRLTLPTLGWQYFDPASGKIVSASHRPPTTLVIGLAGRIAIALLIGLLLIAAGRYFYKHLLAVHRARRLRRQALREIGRAEDFTALHQALRLFARAEGWPGNLTLTAWSRYWGLRYQRDDEFRDVLQQLSQACYGQLPSPGLAVIRSRLMTQLNARRRAPKRAPKRALKRATMALASTDSSGAARRSLG